MRKKSGEIRLCVDLRPLNARVEKQKYPFPRIEDCLAKLAKKTIFTLLDLRDGFHQIKVNQNSAKYFAFATLDGQFEYQRLPFGYSEAPAEFQKRIMHLLNPWSRTDKIVIFMDDILIPTETIEENLIIMEEIMTVLRSFDLNFKKCQFVKRSIEFLGYYISEQGITLSPRHTSAVRDFKRPTIAGEVQKFLGLASYFRKFICDFARKARPLYQLLKRDVDFVFDEECENAFNQLKKELTSSPVLRLYDPSAVTELHTDASSLGLGAILLQRQKNDKWGPVAYFSQTTNQAETRFTASSSKCSL